jgi:hypothetical protein
MVDYDKPDEDPIIAEVRAAREAYAAQFSFDLRAIFADLQRRARGHPAVSREARPEPATKKVG